MNITLNQHQQSSLHTTHYTNMSWSCSQYEPELKEVSAQWMNVRDKLSKTIHAIDTMTMHIESLRKNDSNMNHEIIQVFTYHVERYQRYQDHLKAKLARLQDACCELTNKIIEEQDNEIWNSDVEYDDDDLYDIDIRRKRDRKTKADRMSVYEAIKANKSSKEHKLGHKSYKRDATKTREAKTTAVTKQNMRAC